MEDRSRHRVLHHKPRSSWSCQEVEEARKDSLGKPLQTAGLPAPGIQTSDPQNCENKFLFFKPPSVWWFVMVARKLGHRMREMSKEGRQT